MDATVTPPPKPPSERFYAWFALALITAGAVVLWPGIRAGMITDDYMELAILDGAFAAPRSALDLFTFTTGKAEDLQALQRLGSMPYWVHPELKLSFLRPLSSALVIFDREVLGWNLPLCHVHSILWWAALCAAVALFYRRLLPASTALWATALFTLTDAHHFAVTWLANRGGIVSLLFGVLGLQVLLLGRRSLTRDCVALSLFSLSLLGGEWVFPLLGFAVTYPFFVQGTRSIAVFLRALWPMAFPALLFLIVRAALGYGASGSGVYVDPAQEPLRFVTALLVRAPILCGDLLLDIPAHWWDTGSPWRYDLLRLGLIEPRTWSRLPDWRAVQVFLGASAALLFAWAMRVVLCHQDASRKAVHVALLSAAVLSLIPVSASFPSSRLSLPALVFAAPGMALLIQYGLRSLLFPARLRLPRLVLHAAIAGALIAARIVLPVRTDIAAQAEFFRGVQEWVDTAEIDDAALPDQHVYILDGGTFTPTFFFAYVLHALGRPLPKTSYPITAGHQPIDLYREGPRTILLRPLLGTLWSSDAELFFRAETLPIAPGQHFTLPEMDVEIVKVWKGRPLEIRVTFPRDLNDPRNVFLYSTVLGLAQLTMPHVGEWTRLTYPATPNYVGARRGHYERRIGPLPDFIMDNPAPDFLRYSPRCDQAQRKASWRMGCPQSG